MQINILASANPAYRCILSVIRGHGDAKLIAWLASIADEFKLRRSGNAWLIQVRCTEEAYESFLHIFEPNLVVQV